MMIGESDRSTRSPSRLVTDLRGLLVHGSAVLLMLVGVGGFLYKSLRPGGWLSRVAGDLMDASGWMALFGVGVFVGCAMLLREWLGEPGSRGSRGDVLLYTAMGLGVFFTFELLVNGTL